MHGGGVPCRPVRCRYLEAMRRWAAEYEPFLILACVLLAVGLSVVVIGRSGDSTPMMGVGLAVLALAVIAIQLSVRRRDRHFEAASSDIRDVIGQARARRGELLADDPDEA